MRGITTYRFFKKKPAIDVEFINDGQLIFQLYSIHDLVFFHLAKELLKINLANQLSGFYHS